MKCDHKGTYADDCIVDTVMRHKVRHFHSTLSTSVY